MKRNNSRIRAMAILYNYDLTKELDMDGINLLINYHSEDFEMDLEFSDQLVNGVLQHKKYLDELIATNLEKYTIERLSFVDRNIIRLAVFEMMILKYPIEVVINEYLNITREYSTIPNFDSVKFNNALLDKIARKVELDNNARE